jgi:hypothetical protein
LHADLRTTNGRDQHFSEFTALGASRNSMPARRDHSELRVGFTETDTNQNSRINIDEFRAWWLSE